MNSCTLFQVKSNLKNKSEINILFEEAFDHIQRGSAVLPAIYCALEQINFMNPSEAIHFFSQIRSYLALGQDFIQILSESEFFKNHDLYPEKKLLEQAYLDPLRIKQYWLDWMRGDAETFQFTNSSIYQLLQDFLLKNGTLWIAGEDKIALENIRRSLDDQSRYSNCKIYPNENYESLSLQCKRGNLQPVKAQLILWLDSDGQGNAVGTALDEVCERVPGSAEFPFNRIFRLRKNWKLLPTGNIPSAYETLGLDSTINIQIFSV